MSAHIQNLITHLQKRRTVSESCSRDEGQESHSYHYHNVHQDFIFFLHSNISLREDQTQSDPAIYRLGHRIS